MYSEIILLGLPKPRNYAPYPWEPSAVPYLLKTCLQVEPTFQNLPPSYSPGAKVKARDPDVSHKGFQGNYICEMNEKSGCPQTLELISIRCVVTEDL